jgi:Protein of unknown function (DUF2917)
MKHLSDYWSPAMNHIDMLILQQSEIPFNTPGLFKLGAGQALTIKPQQPSQLRVGLGGLWLTSSRCAGDHFLKPGQHWLAQKGEVLVLEPWQLHCGEAARFTWDVLPTPAHAAAALAAPAEWRVAAGEVRHVGAQLVRAGLHLLRAVGARGLAVVATFFVAARAVFSPAKGSFDLDDLARAATPACKAN